MFVRVLLLAAVVLVLWAAFARPSESAQPETVHVVRAGDTLWAIAERHYAGDPREGVWRIQQRNGLESPLLQPGERLVVPGR
jgi:LysM repeat protein